MTMRADGPWTRRADRRRARMPHGWTNARTHALVSRARMRTHAHARMHAHRHACTRAHAHAHALRGHTWSCMHARARKNVHRCTRTDTHERAQTHGRTPRQCACVCAGTAVQPRMCGVPRCLHTRPRSRMLERTSATHERTTRSCTHARMHPYMPACPHARARTRRHARICARAQRVRRPNSIAGACALRTAWRRGLFRAASRSRAADGSTRPALTNSSQMDCSACKPMPHSALPNTCSKQTAAATTAAAS